MRKAVTVVVQIMLENKYKHAKLAPIWYWGQSLWAGVQSAGETAGRKCSPIYRVTTTSLHDKSPRTAPLILNEPHLMWFQSVPYLYCCDSGSHVKKSKFSTSTNN